MAGSENDGSDAHSVFWKLLNEPIYRAEGGLETKQLKLFHYRVQVET